MRIYEPQNIGQWVMQYLGNDNVLSPFAGNIRPGTTDQALQVSSGAATTAASSLPANENLFDPSAIADLIRSISDSGSSGGGGGSSSGSSNANPIQWYDPYGRPLPGPTGVRGSTGIRSTGGWISSL